MSIRDLSLPYNAAAADVQTTATPLPVPWVQQETGAIEFEYKPLPYQIRGAVDPQNGNGIIIPWKIRSSDFWKAVPNILGWSETAGGDGGRFLKRRLPVGDNHGFGAVALRIPSFRFHGQSVIKAGVGFVLRSIVSTIRRNWMDDCNPDGSEFNKIIPGRTYTTIEGTTADLYNFLGSDVEAIKQTRYCTLDIFFGHAPYNINTDQRTYSPGQNTYGDERFRYCWAEWVGGAEYVTSKALTLKFAATADPTVAGKMCATESGIPRNNGELLVHWEKVPAPAVRTLFAKYSSRYGQVNSTPFKVNLFGGAMEFAEQTLMFNHCRPAPRMQPHGFLEYDLTFSFSFRANGWSKFITNRIATPQPVVRESDNSEPFTPTEFSALFRLDGA